MDKFNQLLFDLDYMKSIYKDIVKTYIENNFDIKGKYNEYDLKLFVKINYILTYCDGLIYKTRDYIKNTGKLYVLEINKIITQYGLIKHFDNINHDIICGICAVLKNMYGNNFFMYKYPFEHCPFYMHKNVADNIEAYYKEMDELFDKILKLIYNSLNEYTAFASLIYEK
jgi:aspartyl/asparaginyl-tRNA synthetase